MSHLLSLAAGALWGGVLGATLGAIAGGIMGYKLKGEENAEAEQVGEYYAPL